jgi:hypothetical protein
MPSGMEKFAEEKRMSTRETNPSNVSFKISQTGAARAG